MPGFRPVSLSVVIATCFLVLTGGTASAGTVPEVLAGQVVSPPEGDVQPEIVRTGDHDRPSRGSTGPMTSSMPSPVQDAGGVDPGELRRSTAVGVERRDGDLAGLESGGCRPGFGASSPARRLRP